MIKGPSGTQMCRLPVGVRTVSCTAKVVLAKDDLEVVHGDALSHDAVGSGDNPLRSHQGARAPSGVCTRVQVDTYPGVFTRLKVGVKVERSGEKLAV